MSRVRPAIHDEMALYIIESIENTCKYARMYASNNEAFIAIITTYTSLLNVDNHHDSFAVRCMKIWWELNEIKVKLTQAYDPEFLVAPVTDEFASEVRLMAIEMINGSDLGTRIVKRCMCQAEKT